MVIETIDSTTGLGIELCGDIFYKLINHKNKKLICRFAMNTAFIENKTNIYTFDKKGVDPDKIMKNKKFDNNFRIDLIFENCCKTCLSTNPISDLCETCFKLMPV